MNSLEILQELVSAVGPAGQESAIRDVVKNYVDKIGLHSKTDAKGNLLVQLGTNDKPKLVVTAHLDEIAMIVKRVEPDGSIAVTALGGLFPWKLGEGAVQILGDQATLDGVLSFGSIHTAAASSTVCRADSSAITWEMAFVFTGLFPEDLAKKGVRPGTRVVVHPRRRQLFHIGDFVSGHFLDDRADLVSWILALSELKDSKIEALFIASAAEEVGGEGALFAMQPIRPDVCIALELGPSVPDAPIELSGIPTVWSTDSYSTMSSSDGALVSRIGKELGMNLQFQSLSRGGSDASCAAGKGICARPITLGLPMENSHGFEIMHKDAMDNLAKLTVRLVKELK